MKKLLWIALGMSLTAPLYAWDGVSEDMKTMSDNMSGPTVRVVKAYPGMFRGWSDNRGFKRGAIASLAEQRRHIKKQRIKYRRYKKYHRHHHHRKHYKRIRSGACIAKCYCKHH